MKLLKAFTLMELLVGMIISSLVIVFSYGAYELIYKQFLMYKSVKSKVVETTQFTTVLTTDFSNAQTVRFANNTIDLQLDNNTICYKLLDSVVVREFQEVSDTFQLKPIDIIANEVYPSQMQDNMLIDQILFDADVNGEVQHFTFVKHYPADVLLVNDRMSE